MKTVCVYHSIDLDGWMSAAIVKHWFLKDRDGIDEKYQIVSIQDNNSVSKAINGQGYSLDFIGYNYGQPIPDLSEYDKVIMCDISFPKEEMIRLETWGNSKGEGEYFTWIDHHISAMKENDTAIFGLRDIKYAACELTWKYFFPNETMPEIVRLLGRYDCFGHKGTDEEKKVLEFQYGARQCISNYEEAYYHLQKCLQDQIYNGWEIEIHERGKSIYKYLCTEAKQTYKNGFEIKFKPIKNKVFLGGTCNESTWRDRLIPMLRIDYFNPVVEDWTPTCQEEEYRQKEECNIHLYVITKEMTGVFSIAEVIDSVHSNKETLFIINPDGFNIGQLKSLQATLDMVINHGGIGKITTDILDIALLVNRLDINTFNETYKFICINKERFNPINFGIDYHAPVEELYWCIENPDDYGLLCKNGNFTKDSDNSDILKFKTKIEAIIFLDKYEAESRFIVTEHMWTSSGYDGCACFWFANSVWNFSLYNDNGAVDCSVIAGQYGGGGHRGSSGMRLNNTQFLQLING